MSVLLSSWFVIPAVATITFILVYIWSSKWITWFQAKSAGQQVELSKMLDKLFVEADKKRVVVILMLSSVGLGTIVFILLWPNIIGGFIAAAVVASIGWRFPGLALNYLYEKRCSRFVDQMVEGLTIMSNGISSGLSITQSMERIVDNLPNPISQEFNLVLSQIRLGMTVEDALNELGERIPRPDVQMFVTAINILKETGGNLAETFTTIVITIRERQKVERKIEALTAQGLMQGIIITLVPFVLMAVFLIVDPSYIMPLFKTTLGIILLLVMLALQLIGGLLIRKIVKINV